MGFLELLLIGVGLAMDAFSVSMCKGLAIPQRSWKQMLTVALFFGAAQGIMPAIGWLLGKQFESVIVSVDHWLAFGLLAVIGGKMIFDAIKERNEPEQCGGKLSIRELFVLAIATSIDALAVGITFAFLQVRILPAASIIAVTTFVLSFIGCIIGQFFGARFKTKAQVIGGVALILIGLKILLEHLGIVKL